MRATAAMTPVSGVGTALTFGWLDRWWAVLLVCLAAIAPLGPRVEVLASLARYIVGRAS